MALKVEQSTSTTTNDLLHFTGKYSANEKLRIQNADFKRKLFFRRQSTIRDARWNVKCSDFAQKTHNPIRAIVDGMSIKPNPDKRMIALSIGDPTVFGNLPPAQEILDAMKEVLDENHFNGYAPSVGYTEARQAVADYSAHQVIKGRGITANDVILCSGCSCALDLCIAAIAKDGQNILIPKPGFSIYKTLAEGFGIECKSYNLIPEKSWEIDLDHMESLIDENTAAIILTNPSNPCGSVFTKQHMLDIIKIAEKNFVPIIADEIYEHLVFPGNEYHAFSSLSHDVPVLSCGGITKRFLVPGWRMGWIIVHDRHGALEEVRKGLLNLSVRILGPNSLVQGALPKILKNTPQKFYDGLIDTLQSHAEIAYQMLKKIKGIKPIMPQGAMYMMVCIDIKDFPDLDNELEFVQELVKEQSVFCLPGKCFSIDNFIRIVLTVPKDILIEACDRIAEFCEDHYNPSFIGNSNSIEEMTSNFEKILRD